MEKIGKFEFCTMVLPRPVDVHRLKEGSNIEVTLNALRKWSHKLYLLISTFLTTIFFHMSLLLSYLIQFSFCSLFVFIVVISS